MKILPEVPGSKSEEYQNGPLQAENKNNLELILSQEEMRNNVYNYKRQMEITYILRILVTCIASTKLLFGMSGIAVVTGNQESSFYYTNTKEWQYETTYEVGLELVLGLWLLFALTMKRHSNLIFFWIMFAGAATIMFLLSYLARVYQEVVNPDPKDLSLFIMIHAIEVGATYWYYTAQIATDDLRRILTSQVPNISPV